MKKLLLLSLCVGLLTACGKKEEKESGTTSIDMEALSQQTPRYAVEIGKPYAGVLPCADCEGIKTEITFGKENTVKITRVYVGKDETLFRSNGKFAWNEDGTLTLTEEDGQKSYIKTTEKGLVHLDENRQEIKGSFSDQYLLHPQR